MSEYPKYVVVHESHITRIEGQKPVPQEFPHFHVNRVNGEVTVLVEDEEHEAFATKAREGDAKKDVPVVTDNGAGSFETTNA
jgi:ribose 5-phosphate isomerase